MKRINLVLLAALISGTTIAVIGCGGGNGNSSTPVSIQKQDGYYSVTLDFTNTSHRDVGKQYAAAIKSTVPTYEANVDGFLKTNVDHLTTLSFQILLTRAQAIYPQLDSDYQDEIVGMQDVFNSNVDILGDGILSKNEMLVYQLLGDTMRPVSCSASAVTGPASSTGKPIVSRNVDWTTFSLPTFAGIQALITYKNGSKTIGNIGILGNLGGISAFNQHKIFAAVLDASTGASYPTNLTNKRSYIFDLRHALENYSSVDDIVHYMTSADHGYSFNHLIILANESTAGVIENQVNPLPGAPGNRSFRTSSSDLNLAVKSALPLYSQEWKDSLGNLILNAIATVNDYRLPNNYFTNDPYNTSRWTSYKNLYLAKLNASQKIDVEGMKLIAGYPGPNSDGMMDHGAIFVSEPLSSAPATNDVQYSVPSLPGDRPPAYSTLQSIIVDMSSMELWAHFAPQQVTPPLRPTYKKILNPIY